jgi:hypothetical protein
MPGINAAGLLGQGMAGVAQQTADDKASEAVTQAANAESAREQMEAALEKAKFEGVSAAIHAIQ